MDTDDCTLEEKGSFLDKTMFKDSIFYDYIYPIHNSPKLELVLYKAKITPRIIKDNKKGDYYIKAFPINKEPYSLDSYQEIVSFKEKIKPLSDTNMDEFVEYCLSLLDK